MTTFTLEGFREDGGLEDPMTILCKPAVVVSFETIATLVENFCIDADITGPWEDEDEGDARRSILNAFYKTRKKDTANRHYWKCVVDVPIERTPAEYRYFYYTVLETAGACHLSLGEA